jgi:hypothetical protein
VVILGPLQTFPYVTYPHEVFKLIMGWEFSSNNESTVSYGLNQAVGRLTFYLIGGDNDYSAFVDRLNLLFSRPLWSCQNAVYHVPVGFNRL